jgi:hypothetical protein
MPYSASFAGQERNAITGCSPPAKDLPPSVLLAIPSLVVARRRSGSSGLTAMSSAWSFAPSFQVVPSWLVRSRPLVESYPQTVSWAYSRAWKSDSPESDSDVQVLPASVLLISPTFEPSARRTY